MSPLLSVVAPFYNVERYLRSCLDSIRQQTLGDFECILVDDGSPDGSAHIAEEFVARDPRFILVSDDNQGIGPARNWGASLARGRYLTFVDSDDLVPPRAFSLLTAVLEETGSSFAAGNARRFGGPDGVTQSWTHSIPFAKTQLATHIDVHPQLIRDRMPWNKVYRRDFWEAADLSFPAMRYEDYPVSMRAHFAATSVDVISDHIYYWRERETGDSITQSLFRLDNMRDRVRSAMQTLDIVQEFGTRTAFRLMTEYFIDIDLVALARGLVHGAPEDLPSIATMGRDLAQRLEPLRRPADPLADVIHEAYLREDLAMVRAMARWRDGEGVGGIRAEIRGLPRPAQSVPLLKRAIPRKRLQSPRGPRRLRSSLIAMSMQENTCSLDIDVRLRPQMAHRASTQVILDVERASVALPHTRHHTTSGLRLTVTAGVDDFEQFETQWEEAEVRIRVTLGALVWEGSVDANPALLTGPVLAAHTAHQWGAPQGHDLRVARTDRLHVASAHSEDGVFVLTHPDLDNPTISVIRPYPTAPAIFVTDGNVSRMDVGVLLDDPPDEPVSGVVERPVVVERVLEDVPLLLVDEPAAITIGHRRAEITRDGRGALVVRLSPSALASSESAAVAAEVEDHDTDSGSPPRELGVANPEW
ncbi:MAG: glycosyltransferase family 2 protein [Dermatophilaceae bacterium]|nr:glycosyltransferase [Intrasporangiaceae bacterium]